MFDSFPLQLAVGKQGPPGVSGGCICQVCIPVLLSTVSSQLILGSSLSRSWAITLRALSRCQSEDFLISHVPLVSHFFIFVDSNKRYHQEVRYLVAIVFIVCDDDQISMIAGLIGIITTLMLTSMLVSTSVCLCFICCQCGL